MRSAAMLPHAEYVFLVDVLPRNHAGRSASILTKTRQLWEHASVRSTIATAYDSSQLDDIGHQLRARNLLAEGVTLASLHDYAPDAGNPPAGEFHRDFEEQGMTWIESAEAGQFHFFEHGRHRLSKRIDYAGRPIVLDWFDGARNHTAATNIGQAACNGAPSSSTCSRRGPTGVAAPPRRHSEAVHLVGHRSGNQGALATAGDRVRRGWTTRAGAEQLLRGDPRGSGRAHRRPPGVPYLRGAAHRRMGAGLSAAQRAAGARTAQRAPSPRTTTCTAFVQIYLPLLSSNAGSATMLLTHKSQRAEARAVRPSPQLPRDSPFGAAPLSGPLGGSRPQARGDDGPPRPAETT